MKRRAELALQRNAHTSDFSSELNIRGGSSDQNLILLNGIEVYKPTHLGGLFSIFNMDAIKDVKLYKGGFPAKYGGRLSAVVDVADPTAPVVPGVRVNEALTHTDPPQVDTIELFNPTGLLVDVAGWFLSDDFNQPKKYRIPAGTSVAAGGYLQFTEAMFNSGANGFLLSSTGDEVYLFSGDASTNLTGYTCDCEGNFDGDADQDGTDAFSFKAHLGRSTILNPCANGNLCSGILTVTGMWTELMRLK